MDGIQAVLRQRFDAKWKRCAQTGCWLWTASTAGKGYGQLRVPGTRRNVYAHRFSYELFKGPVPRGMHLMHSCDNPRCVNPDHLSIGTCKDNLQDMKAKDRSTFGERNKRATLTTEQVEAIKILLSSSAMSQAAIARQFGVHQMEISRIKRGERWARVRPDLTMPSTPIIRRA